MNLLQFRPPSPIEVKNSINEYVVSDSETGQVKGAKRLLTLKPAEADMARCYKKHSVAPDQDFKVVISPGEV